MDWYANGFFLLWICVCDFFGCEMDSGSSEKNIEIREKLLKLLNCREVAELLSISA
jgi:hypothetical protein